MKNFEIGDKKNFTDLLKQPSKMNVHLEEAVALWVRPQSTTRTIKCLILLFLYIDASRKMLCQSRQRRRKYSYKNSLR